MTSQTNPVIRIFAGQIYYGYITIQDVPAVYRDRVTALLATDKYKEPYINKHRHTMDSVDGLEEELNEVTVKLAEKAKFEGQADYVEMVKNLTGYKRLRVKRTDNSTPSRLNNFLIDVVLDDGEKHITHQWKKNNNDDLYIYSNAFVGVLGRTVFTRNIPTLNGSFNTGSVATFTTTPGDSFTATVNGDEIVFNHYADHRGGLWEFVIDDDNYNKILVSTYSPSVNSTKSVVLKAGLITGQHKVVATFLGDDPMHPITTEKSRGWLKYSPTATVDGDFALLGYIQGNVYNAGQGDLLGSGSNKEFAITGVKNGKTNWFPEHNQIGTCFAVVPNRYLLDGKEIDFSKYTDKEFIEGNSNFKIIQQMYFQFPETTEQIAKLSMVSTINMDGVVAISGGLEVLSNFTATGYAMMFPLGRGVNEFVSSIGNSKLNAADESTYNMEEEKDLTYSFAGISPVNRDYIAAMTVDFPSTTLRQGKQGRREDLSRFTYIHQRATFPKLYQVSLENAELVAGDKLGFHGRFTIGEIPNIYDVIKP